MTNRPTHQFQMEFDSVQCNMALAITRAIKNFSRDKLHQELELKYLSPREKMVESIVFALQAPYFNK